MKKNNLKKVLYILFLVLVPSVQGQTGHVIYVDNSISSWPLNKDMEISSGVNNTVKYTYTYDKATRSATGGNDTAYFKTLDAFQMMMPGDTVQIRVGVYDESYDYLDRKTYTEKSQAYIMSYPGEWAVLKGRRTHRALNGVKYLNFSSLEITGGSLSIGSAQHCTFKQIYGHNSMVGGTGDEYIGGLICLWNNTPSAAQNNLFEYCYFHDNWNANILIFGDYVVNPAVLNESAVVKNNEIRYCLFDGENSGHSIQYKNPQFLINDPNHSGLPISWADMGDKWHHNVFRKAAAPIIFGQDFIQIYNNYFDSAAIAVVERYGGKREVQHVYMYNNTFNKCLVSLNHNQSATQSYLVTVSGTRKLNPYFYYYNNIHRGYYNSIYPIEILYSEHNIWQAEQIDFTTVFCNKNLFTELDPSYKLLRAGDENDLYTASQFTGILDIGEALTITNKILNPSTYSIDSSIVLSGTSTTKNWGVNINHTYLAGVKIPSYIGHYEPGNNWMNIVLSLTKLKEGKVSKLHATIIEQPTSDTVDVGKIASFSVTATGTNLSYQWVHNNKNVGTNSNTYSFTTTLNNNKDKVWVKCWADTGNSIWSDTVFVAVNNSTIPTQTIAFNSISSSGAESLNIANLQVDLSATSEQITQVDYTVTGTATGGGTDYTLANGTLTINAGETRNNIIIASIVDDPDVEVDETIIVTLSNPVNATLGANTVHTYTITDNDNATNVSDISKSNLSVYPNPTTDKLFIQSNTEINSELIISIYDNIGRILYSQMLDELLADGAYEIDISTFTNGIYILQINNSKSITIEKIIKQ